MSESKFNFYEMVRIETSDEDFIDVNGEEATVLAKVQCDDGQWYYTVAKSDGYTVSLYESQMVSLGRFAKREDIFTGELIKVGVNEKGEGYLKEEE